MLEAGTTTAREGGEAENMNGYGVMFDREPKKYTGETARVVIDAAAADGFSSVAFLGALAMEGLDGKWYLSGMSFAVDGRSLVPGWVWRALEEGEVTP